MKKILILLFLFSIENCIAQKVNAKSNNDSVSNNFAIKKPHQIYKKHDDMDGTDYFITSDDIVLSNDKKDEGLILSAFIENNEWNPGTIKFADLKCKMIGIGSDCVEKNELILMFSDSSTIKLTSWNDFNCDGDAWFHVGEDDARSLSSKKIIKARITNGRTYDSFTKNIRPSYQDYYIYLFAAIKNQNFVSVK